MRVLMRVAELGSLTAASIDMGYTRSTASIVLSDLERYLGVQLMERTTRRLRLTEDGQRYLERAREIVAAVEQLEEEVGGAERQPRGLLRVQIPVGLTRLVVAPSLPRFAAAYPEIELQILSRNGLPDFVGAEIDAAVVVGPLPELDLVARPAGHIPVLTVAAPAYLAAHGAPTSVADLPAHRCIPILSTSTGRPVPWQFRENGESLSVSVRGPLAFEAAEAAVAAAVRGAGLLQLASYLVYEEVRSGKLVTVLHDARPAAAEVRIVHPRHRLKPKKLKVFEDFLLELNMRTRARWGVRDTAPVPGQVPESESPADATAVSGPE